MAPQGFAPRLVRAPAEHYHPFMKAAADVRVSSKTQDHATQRSAIERAAEARGDTIIAWHAEKMSGKTLARPELDGLDRRSARARSQALRVSS